MSGTPSPSLDAARAFLYMDAARALLAGMVAFGHAWALLIEDYRPTGNLLVQFAYFAADFGHPSVILFFVLSGFWIGRSVIASSAESWSWRDYLGARLTRLMPVVVPALLLGGVLDAIGLWSGSSTHLGRTDTYVLPASVSPSLTLTSFVGNIAFLQQILVPPFGSNGPLWSLAYEFWYYIWFPALWLALRYRRPSIALATVGMGLLHPDLFVHFPVWLAGVALVAMHSWCERNPDRLLSARRWLWVPAAIAFMVILFWSRMGNYRGEDYALGIAFAILILGGLLRRPPPLPGLAAFGSFGHRASFSLYVTHFPLMAFIAALTIGDQRLVPDAIGGLVVLLAMLTALSVAWLFASVTEANTDRIRGWSARWFGCRRDSSCRFEAEHRQC